MKRFLGLFLVLTFCFLAVSYQDTRPVGGGTDEEKIQNAINQTVVPATTHKGLSLPTSFGDVTIEWTTDEELLLDPSKTFYANSEYIIELVGTYISNSLVVSHTYEVKVEETSNGVFQNAWEYFSKKIPSSTATNFTLHPASKEYNGCKATYRSLNQDAVSDSGKINQSLEDKQAKFITYLDNGSMIMIYPKDITVLKYTDSQRINFVIDWLYQEMEKVQLAEGSKYPEYNDQYDVYISWYSKEFGLITENGTIIRPLTAQDVKFGCILSTTEMNKTLSFNIEDFGGNISMIDRLKLWCEGSIQTTLRGTKNYVDPETDHLTKQIRINSNGVLSLTLGEPVVVDTTYLIDTSNVVYKNFGSGAYGTNTHPAVPQSKLDELFYPGYKMPNDQNILWIVVHESGMPRTGQDAKLLAEMQVRYAYETRRQASWNYQVDEKVIYQSFDDSIVCWHASDGTGVAGGGNNNGIGIEMCINGDGNYEGAMKLNARLIAQLMYKYNLTLDNVRRHYDFAPDKKQCPYYMIETERWEEFLGLINREYIAHKYYQEGVRFSWTVTDENGNNALDQYFVSYGQGLYASKPVSTEVVLNVTLTATYEGQSYTFTKKLKLNPESEESNE